MNPETPQPNMKDFSACRARLLGNSDIVECLMMPLKCQWVVPFADGLICKHPAAMQFVRPDELPS